MSQAAFTDTTIAPFVPPAEPEREEPEEGGSRRPRRSFLKTLLTAPLAAVGVHHFLLAPKGAPAVQAATPKVLAAYAEWLYYEHRLLMIEMFPDPALRKVMEKVAPTGSAARFFHFPMGRDWRELPQPSTRALAVLNAVGCDLTREPPAEDRWSEVPLPAGVRGRG